MEDSPERQALEEALKDEPVGSAKIQALADYATLKEVEYKLIHKQANMKLEEELELIVQKPIIEQAIRQQRLSRNANEYIEAFDNAGEILKPYFERYNGNPGQVLLDALREINRGKSRK